MLFLPPDILPCPPTAPPPLALNSLTLSLPFHFPYPRLASGVLPFLSIPHGGWGGGMDYIERAVTAQPALAEPLGKLGDLYNRKLWHQLTDSLLEVVKNPEYTGVLNLYELYEVREGWKTKSMTMESRGDGVIPPNVIFRNSALSLLGNQGVWYMSDYTGVLNLYKLCEVRARREGDRSRRFVVRRHS
jgi:hypothetical protein